MILDFFGFIVDCFLVVVKLFQNTVIDGISYETLIVAACMLSIVLTSLVIRFRPSFRPPEKPSGPRASKDPDD